LFLCVNQLIQNISLASADSAKKILLKWLKMSEKVIQAEIQLELAKVGVRLWRNNVGMLEDRNGQKVKYGLCKGSSDLIGLTPIKITSEMVGKTVAVFTALEVKTKSGRATPEQVEFIYAINNYGGIAAIVRSKDDAISAVKK
jgi:hypothetical protein